MWRKSEVFRFHLNAVAAAVQDDSMRTLFAKILLAQAITAVVALVVVAVITRASLNRGFIEFLERQEAAVLDSTAPALSDLYESQGGWGFLREQPENWHRILRRTRGMRGQQGLAPGAQAHARPGLRPTEPLPGPSSPPGFEPPLRWMGSMDRLHLRERLFLLDADRSYLAGAEVIDRASERLEPIVADGRTVGWIGFAPMGKTLPPEANRFLLGQVRVLSASLLIALGLAALLGFLLARHLSRPIRELMQTVSDLSLGRYEQRATVTGHDEVSRLSRAVNELAANLDQSRSARRRWMTDIAHELRTPVAILKGEIEALADGVRQPDQNKLNSLGEEINQLAVLVDDLQTLALSDAGALNLQREAIDLVDLVRQVAGPFQERLASRGIELRLDLPHTLRLNADPQRLRQLLQNLMENTVRYTEADGWVRVVVSATLDGSRLTVEDSGPGVSPAQLEQLFERFYRAGQGRPRAGGGSGLGLSICRNIAQAHGGRIHAVAGAAGGLAIHVDLPR